MGRRCTARGSGRRRAGRVGGGLAALLAGLLVTGCAAFDTDDDVRRARELAAELYPGELEVIFLSA